MVLEAVDIANVNADEQDSADIERMRAVDLARMGEYVEILLERHEGVINTKSFRSLLKSEIKQLF